MKHLSFIALFFYLGSLLPAALFSAAHNWVDLPQSSAVHGLSQLTSAAQPVKHFALSDDNDKTIVQLHYAGFVSAVERICQFSVTEAHTITTLCFSARAPPLHLG